MSHRPTRRLPSWALRAGVGTCEELGTRIQEECCWEAMPPVKPIGSGLALEFCLAFGFLFASPVLSRAASLAPGAVGSLGGFADQHANAPWRRADSLACTFVFLAWCLQPCHRPGCLVPEVRDHWSPLYVGRQVHAEYCKKQSP